VAMDHPALFCASALSAATPGQRAAVSSVAPALRRQSLDNAC